MYNIYIYNTYKYTCNFSCLQEKLCCLFYKPSQADVQDPASFLKHVRNTTYKTMLAPP